MVDGGSWYVREAWPHDGNPIESKTFIVYSDAADLEARRKVADVAEDTWAELLGELGIGPEMLTYPEGQDKLHIYAFQDYNPKDWEARAYHGGLLMWSPDHEQQLTARTRFAPVIKHELVHVLQWLLAGPNSPPLEAWFTEGLPEAITGGTAGGAIRARDRLDHLTADYGLISPISVESYAEITSADAGERFYYPMFQLAVEYLIAEDGYGRSWTDMRDVMIDVGEGESFESAFEAGTGVGLDGFETEFFSLMSGYLPQYRSPLFTPAGLWAISGLVIVLVAGALVLAGRRWQLGTSTEGADELGTGMAARIFFSIEIGVAGLLVIGFFVGALFFVATLSEFNNMMYTPIRTWAIWLLAAYLLASVAVLLWALHRFMHHSRSAFLVAPLVLAATVATVIIFVATI